jgi:hypothetical protein
MTADFSSAYERSNGRVAALASSNTSESNKRKKMKGRREYPLNNVSANRGDKSDRDIRAVRRRGVVEGRGCANENRRPTGGRPMIPFQRLSPIN